ncbi:imine reductase family protein [Parafrankia elaeagni]|uniref:imine reductase family protein n=1 Tax=Parafrankia elaeagni TaxID=222534 RepID=UPI00037E595A|nr:hypothetical protein [Parafrankia elaeagni]
MTTRTTFLGLGAMGSALAAGPAGRTMINLTTTTPGQARELAATVDAEDYAGAGQQSLEFTEAALASLVTASLEAGVQVDVLRPVHDIVRRQIAAGHGRQGTARIFEELRSTR